MSKLQDDGALMVASLRFAAALLPPDVTPHEVCTKTALSAIVLASHRLAQQATAQLKLPLGADPRRLLTELVESDLDEQLARVSVADITWDSEGVASQTLEMELCDVQERASATLQRSVCILISVGSSTSAVKETAVVWFPRRREDDNNNNSDNKSPKYLLFVAPGRVKVVKSLSELMKKMHEEMAVLRDRDATYRAWTLVDGAKRKKDAKLVGGNQSKAKKEPVAHPNTLPASSPVKNEPQRQKEEMPEQDRVFTKWKDKNEKLLQDGHTDPPVQRLRVRVVKDEPDERETMFAFARAPLVEPIVEDRLNNNAMSSEPATIEQGNNPLFDELVIAETQHEPPMQKSEQRFYLGVSASHADARALKDNKVTTTDVAVWQSVDGEIKRTRRVIQDTPAVNDDLTTDNEARAKVADTPREVLAVQTNSQDVVDSTRTRQARVRPCAVQKELPPETMFQFSSTRALQPPSPTAMSSVPVVSKTQQPDPFVPLAHSAVAAQSNQDVEEQSIIFPPEITEDVQAPIKKKRSARDHYRSKLGARVWWELEYQATKILQQGMSAGDRSADFQSAVRETKKATRQSPSEAPTKVIVSKPEDEMTAVRRTRASSPSTTPIVSFPELTQTNTEAQHNAQLRSPTTPSIPIQSRILATGRHAWQEKTTQGPIGNEEVKICGDAPKLPVEAAARADHTSEERKLAIIIASQPDISANHRKSVETAPSVVPDQTPTLKHWAPSESDHVVQPRLPPVKDDAMRSAIVPSLRKTESRAQADFPSAGKHNNSNYPKNYHAPSPLREARKAPVSPETQSTSKRFSARQSRARYEDVSDENDDVLMATMALRTSSSIPARAAVPPHVTEATEVEDIEVDDVPVHCMPFNVHGRVPIRRPQQTQHVVEPEIHQDEHNEDDDDHEYFNEPLSPPRQEVPKPRVHRSPPLMATFISVEPNPKPNTKLVRDEDATQRVRQHKLTELRQKKLLQLQKARDDALNKKKPSTQQLQQQTSQSHSTSIAVPLESKLGARAVPPPTTSAMDRSEAFPIATTTRTGHRPSNRKLIQNAIEYTLLAGGSLDKERQAAVDALAESTCENFIVLLKSAKELKFRALYEHHMERGRIVKIYGLASSAPPLLTEDVISQFFRYNSGKKEFAAIDGRSFTVKTDACALVDQLVFKKKPLHRLL